MIRFLKSSQTKERKQDLQSPPMMQAGLTLIEVLVVIALIGIVTGIVLVNQSSFSKSVTLQNLTQEVALVITRAQKFGVNSRSTNFKGSEFASGRGTFAHGVYFDISGTNDKEIILFRDKNGSEDYDSSEIIQSYKLPGSARIHTICFFTNNNQLNNNNSCDSSNQRNNLMVLFDRPHPDAEFYSTNGNHLNNGVKAAIILEAKGRYEAIIVSSSGYITTTAT